MPNILAIETSSDVCSLALSSGKESVTFHELIPQQHSEKLLGIIQELMNKLNLSYQDLDVVATGCGPGSFTGTRLACSVTQGLSYSVGIPAISVSSMQIIAQGINREFKFSEVKVLVNAHMEQLYFGDFTFNLDQLVSAKERVIKIKEFNNLNFAKFSVFAGNGCKLVKGCLSDFRTTIYERYPNAKDLLLEAEKKLNEGETIDPKDLMPVYLSGEDQWVKK